MSGSGISVLTLVKHRRRHLQAMLEGLRRCDPLPGELIVVVMDDKACTIPDLPFPVRVIRFGTTGLPLATARNRAGAAASCAHLLFLDVDCIPMRGLPGAMTEHLTRHDGLICPEVLYLPADVSVTPADEAGLIAQGVAHPARQFPRHGVIPVPQPGLFWSVAFGVRRALFAALGGFDERFTGYGGEDTDLAFRAARAGLPILLAGGPGAVHQHHPVSEPPLQHFHDIVRNARLFHSIWGVWPMVGWLDGFAALGLIERRETALIELRPPTDHEIAAARRPEHGVV